tara:strand:- start:22 stop:1014 length:993 start_codon:yes stop_codon:yes gene_type:complete
MTPDAPMVSLMEEEYYLDDTGELIHFEDHQRRILNEVFTPNEEGKIGYETVVWSTPKKEGKTGVAGAVGYGFSRVFGGNAFSIANDKEQAGERMFDRVVSNLRHMKNKNPALFETIVQEDYQDRITKNNMIEFNKIDQINPGPHWLKFVAADYAGEAGGRPAMTCFDELWAYKGDRMARLWDEFQPLSIMPVSLRFITTYAGWYGESELLWSIYDTVVKPDDYNPLEKHGTKVPGLEDLPVYQYGDKYVSGSYLVYWDHENRMPWKSKEYLEGRRKDPAVKGREAEYRRLWKNEWTTGMDAFLSPELVDELMAIGEEHGLVNHMADWDYN